jgi:biopolymer transport protein ExbB
MFALLADGGPFIWLLLVLSVISVALILERGWMLRRSRVMPPALVEALNTRDLASLRGTCAATPSPLSRLVLVVLDHLRWPKEETTSAVEVKARREVADMERGLVVLEVIVGIAPLIGLVGTIYGIIPLFVDFGKAISGDYALLAKGIGDALNKTLAGLLVAIPTLVAWSYFNKKVEVLAVELEGECDDLIRRQYLGVEEPKESVGAKRS